MVHLMLYFVVMLCGVKPQIPVFDVCLYNTRIELLIIKTFTKTVISPAEYHSVFLNISCSQFVVFVRKINLCEEKDLSGCMVITGQNFNAAIRVGSFSSQSSKPVNIVSLYDEFLYTVF